MKFLIGFVLLTTLAYGQSLNQIINNADQAHAPVRNSDRELRQGKAVLQPRYDKDEAAYKALSQPSAAQIAAEKNMSICFNKARSTKGMYNIPDGQEMKANCDTYFKPLEDLLK